MITANYRSRSDWPGGVGDVPLKRPMKAATVALHHESVEHHIHTS